MHEKYAVHIYMYAFGLYVQPVSEKTNKQYGNSGYLLGATWVTWWRGGREMHHLLCTLFGVVWFCYNNEYLRGARRTSEQERKRQMAEDMERTENKYWHSKRDVPE